MRLMWLALASAMLAFSASAAPPPAPPAAVAARIAYFNATCRSVGGAPLNSPYIFVHDYTGDGIADYLVSEGDFQCSGRPRIFWQNESARIQIFVSDGRGGAESRHNQLVIGYRIVDGRPPYVQIVHSGSVCGPTAAQNTRCGATLRWNPASRNFDFVPTGASAQAAPAAAPQAGAATAPLSTTPVVAETEAAFLVRCRTETLRANPAAARWVDGECKERWPRVRASQGMAETILKLVSNPSGPRDQAAVRAQLPGMTFTGRPGQSQLFARQGALDVALIGAPQVDSVSWSWDAVGQLIPYEVDQALIGRGVGLTLIGCQALNVGEVSRVYRATPRVGAPFALHIYAREAPTANANSSYSVTADINGRVPTLRDLNARGDGFTPTCPN